MAYSEHLPARLNPLAERTCFPQALAAEEAGAEEEEAEAAALALRRKRQAEAGNREKGIRGFRGLT
jgi:hypothetical protein